ncbi:MAG: hypothetical protein VKJ05_07355 [Synechococcaceae cyanobacterium]|nr:hypothetical protein [Synechococcaceae cyanobacterium]
MRRAVRQRLFAAVIGALLGSALARAIEPLGQGPDGVRFRSPPYQRLHRSYPPIGAGVGALAALGFATLAQARRQAAREEARRRSLRRGRPPAGEPSAGSRP